MTPYLLRTISLAFLIIQNNSGFAQSDYSRIIGRFEQWKKEQYKNGAYETENRCNLDSVSKIDYKGPDVGIPKDLNIYFTDINNDSRLDALVAFHPDQCDHGNALMNAQVRLLILSHGENYTVDQSFIDKIEKDIKKGWLNIESVTDGTFYGTYYQYKENDGRCCPSIKRPIQIDYKSGKLIYLAKN